MNIAFGRLANNTIGVLCLIFMVAPLFLVVLFSFGSSSLMTFPMAGFTLDWYRALVSREDFWSALENSAIITGSVGVLATAIGTTAAMVIARMRPKQSATAFFLFGLPMMMPPLVLALALLSLFSVLGVKLSLITVVLAHLTFTMPFVILIVTARLRDFDYTMIDSARDLGASPAKTFFTVTFPLIRPTLFGAALIAMALSLDDFVITFFLIGGGNTLPTLVWGMLRTGLDPSINALGTLILLLTIGSSAVALRLTRYRG
ncbi:ABC transporter permease [Sinorhizobium sp. BG8]|uniref:ABC transporter permease n=1 Tax=Sinorhizobium sp. BG8 TaxID=2613773 RepID=UPI00193C8C50|nr:ABC transporter permease [Sinorhizobium sp. BG8]QRM57671.1 ABC transporter permease [Sinorhizobium sp. BG8]